MTGLQDGLARGGIAVAEPVVGDPGIPGEKHGSKLGEVGSQLVGYHLVTPAPAQSGVAVKSGAEGRRLGRVLLEETQLQFLVTFGLVARTAVETGVPPDQAVT